MSKSFRHLLVMVAILCVAIVGLFMILEKSLIYPAPGADVGNWEPGEYQYEPVDFVSLDGTVMHGWYFPHAQARASVLFAHGNGENVALLGREMNVIRDLYRINVFAFDWRGYGKSAGSPGEKGILEDADAALQWLAKRNNLGDDGLVLWGRSLGGAVAVHLAAKHGARGLILDRTFSSMVDVASSHMPFLPVRWLLKNRFESDKKITSYTGPIIQFHGEPDDIVPFETGKKLFEAAQGNDKQFITSQTLGHNAPWPEDFHRAVDMFIDSVAR